MGVVTVTKINVGMVSCLGAVLFVFGWDLWTESVPCLICLLHRVILCLMAFAFYRGRWKWLWGGVLGGVLLSLRHWFLLGQPETVSCLPTWGFFFARYPWYHALYCSVSALPRCGVSVTFCGIVWPLWTLGLYIFLGYRTWRQGHDANR